MTSARSNPRPGRSLRASSHASGTPSTRQSKVARLAHSSESFSAWPTSLPDSSIGKDDQGARTSSPASGTTRNARPSTAGTTRTSGSRPRGTRRPVMRCSCTGHALSKPAPLSTARPLSDST
jgi:hypothetical protein